MHEKKIKFKMIKKNFDRMDGWKLLFIIFLFKIKKQYLCLHLYTIGLNESYKYKIKSIFKSNF